MEHAIDLSDVGVNDIYKIDILRGMKKITSVWKEISAEAITKSWQTTVILPDQGLVTSTVQK